MEKATESAGEGSSGGERGLGGPPGQGMRMSGGHSSSSSYSLVLYFETEDLVPFPNYQNEISGLGSLVKFDWQCLLFLLQLCC